MVHKLKINRVFVTVIYAAIMRKPNQIIPYIAEHRILSVIHSSTYVLLVFVFAAIVEYTTAFYRQFTVFEFVASWRPIKL